MSASLTSAADLAALLDRASGLLLTQQTPAGYWWYTLEANETIGAEYIFLEHCLGTRTPGTWERLAARILAEQLPSGGWPLAAHQDADLSTTIECYVALRMAGFAADHAALQRARRVILDGGGVAAVRVFTQIHFALLGLIPWSRPPTMPVEIMLLPGWSPISIYSFSSWARACIVPLLVLFAKHPVYPVALPGLLEEITAPTNGNGARNGRRDIWSEFFVWVDRLLKLTRPFAKRLPTKDLAVERAIEWIRTHLARTEDIFPALSYGTLALHAMGATTADTSVAKALAALRRFQHTYDGPLPALPFPAPDRDPAMLWAYERDRCVEVAPQLHQQCCISPGWDTPWAMCALRAAGMPRRHPALTKAAEWLRTQQVTQCYGDWYVKNPDVEPGGWSFEFENDFFPDLDDTIQIVLALEGQGMDDAVARALRWCLSMQNDDGGCAAFDKNNSLAIVNKIPFADHGACLDPSTPDITGRWLLMLARHGYTPRERAVTRAIQYLQRTQESNGAWFGRWGVNYLYGTWAALTGLRAIGLPSTAPEIQRARQWLLSVQQSDGGFGESVQSYPREEFISAPSMASQTAWGLMALLSSETHVTEAAHRAAHYLTTHFSPQTGWAETAYTGTGFPGHFYIRYHGYRHYFPVLALGAYQARCSS